MAGVKKTDVRLDPILTTEETKLDRRKMGFDDIEENPRLGMY